MPRRQAQTPAEQFVDVEDLLVRVTILRRQSRYRQLLVEGTGLDGRVTTMRLIRVVDALERSGSPPSVRQVAERLVMEHSNTSRAVDQAVDQGLLTKSTSFEDARRVELQLSPKGKRAIEELNVRRGAIHRELTQGWSQTELTQFVALLEKLCGAYEKLEA